MRCPHIGLHKRDPEKGRQSESHINHYLCAQKMEYRQAWDQANRVQAKMPEAGILDKIERLIEDSDVLEQALDIAWARLNRRSNRQKTP